MPAGRIVALDLIQRIRQQDLEGQAAILSGLNQKIAKTEGEIEFFLGQIQGEAHVTSIESAPYVGDFIRSVRAQINSLEIELNKLAIEAEQIEDRVRAKFIDVKTFGTVLEKAVEAKSLQDRRRENQDLDELTTLRWGRS